MSTEDEFEEFYKDYIGDKRCENIEIEYFHVSRSLFNYINKCENFDLALRDEYEHGNGLKGWFNDIPLYQNGDVDDYEIKTRTLWEICLDCLNQKMYDEKNEVHYCPMCDNRRSRFKDKLFNVLR